MNFVSLRFCAFFVAAVFVYYVLPRRARQPWLLACSCFFYMCWNPAYIVLILFSAFSTYLCGRALAVLGAPAAGNRGRRRAAMAVSLAANLGILFFFKYYNFFAQSANGLLAARGFPAVPLLGVLLPVGISFYTFQAIGYTVDVYRGSVSAEQRFWRYLLFISFFPQLVAGPIERSGNILPQLQLPARFFYERAKSGLVLMLWGYIQKMVVADRLALLADTVYAQGGALGGWATAAATVLFCFELYCDFSSYTDIARGAARICAENGVPVLDYNTPGGRDIGFDYATDLADHAHVNTAGAQKISTDLAAYLAEHYGMPDKRGDAAYAAWDEAARMEHRDAQNITLRFTLDMAEYFRLLMQDKDLAAVITTQGDATEADPSAPRAVFRQWGLDTLPLEQSGMQGLYVVDGGKVVYQKTGAGPLEYTLSWGGHDVTLRSAADNSSTTVDGEEQSRNRPGVNVLVYDKVLDRVIQSISFSTLHAYSGYTA